MSRRSILARLHRLERDARLSSCTLCNGAGRILSIKAHEAPEPADPEGCPGCGKWTLIVVRRAEMIQKDLTFGSQVRYC